MTAAVDLVERAKAGYHEQGNHTRQFMGGVLVANPDLPQVPDANTVLHPVVPDGTAADAVLAAIDRHLDHAPSRQVQIASGFAAPLEARLALAG
jgi:hypothetical protein